MTISENIEDDDGKYNRDLCTDKQIFVCGIIRIIRWIIRLKRSRKKI